MRRLTWSLVLLFAGVIPAAPQQSPEIDALLDAFFANDVATLLKHLPPQLQKAYADLPQQKRVQLGLVFPLAQKLKQEGVQVSRSDDPAVLATIETGAGGGNREIIDILLDKRISDGYESVVRLRAREKSGSRSQELSPLLQVWFRYEDGEWRVYELQAGMAQSIKLDDPELLKRFSPPAENSDSANEASAVGALRTYNTALVTYAATYEGAGFPTSLDVLGSDEANPDATSSQHAGLVDRTLSTPPYQKAGYRFVYQPVWAAPVSAFTIVARPLEYGKTGKRSFFTDESGVIRFTVDDREPTREDPPLQ